MRTWLRRVRGAIGMGLTWAVGWTVVGMLGLVVTYTLFPDLPDVVDVWIPVFAYPGFISGVAFSAVLGIAGRRRRLDEISLPRVAGWGAVGGLLVSGFIVTVAGFAPWSLVVAGVVMALCSGSAAGSVALAGMAEDRKLLDAERSSRS